MPLNETVLLKGGARGGEVISVPAPAYRAIMPVIAPVSLSLETDAAASSAPPHQRWDADEYRHYGRYRDGMKVLEWVRPDTRKLRDEIAQLRNELDECRAAARPRVGLLRVIDRR